MEQKAGGKELSALERNSPGGRGEERGAGSIGTRVKAGVGRGGRSEGRGLRELRPKGKTKHKEGMQKPPWGIRNEVPVGLGQQRRQLSTGILAGCCS